MLSGKYKSELILILVTILWSATFVIVKEALNDISPMAFIAARFFIAALVMFPFILKRNFEKEIIIAGFFLGLFLFLGFATQTIGLKFTTATKSGFLTGTAVILIPLFQIIIKREIPNTGILIGAIFVLVGIALLSGNSENVFLIFDDISTNFNVGDTLTLLCASFFAMYVIYLDTVSKKFEFLQLLFLQLFSMAILSFVFMSIFNFTSIESIRFNITNNSIMAIVYTAIFATLITTALQTKYQKNVTPAKAGIIFSFEPIFAAVFAFFVLGEKITLFGYLGAGLIFLGLVISEIYESLFLNEK